MRLLGRQNLLSFSMAGLMAIAATVRAEDETKVVKFQDKTSGAEISLTVPADWTQQKPQSNLRLGQFAIPPVEGDEQPGELAIFVFPRGGGDVKSNLNRWIGEFAADDREVKLFKGKSEQGDYYLSDLKGTYNKPVGPPIAGKKMPTPGSRALGVILQVPDKNSFYLKFTGPEMTVTAAEKAYKKSFGADPEKEEVYEIKK